MNVTGALSAWKLCTYPVNLRVPSADRRREREDMQADRKREREREGE